MKTHNQVFAVAAVLLLLFAASPASSQPKFAVLAMPVAAASIIQDDEVFDEEDEPEGDATCYKVFLITMDCGLMTHSMAPGPVGLADYSGQGTPKPYHTDCAYCKSVNKQVVPPETSYASYTVCHTSCGGESFALVGAGCSDGVGCIALDQGGQTFSECASGL